MGDQVFRPTISTYHVIVDYSLTLEQMIQRGNYSEVHPDITAKHFPFPENKREKIKINIHLVHFGIKVNSYKVKDLLKQMGYRFTDMTEFLAFGAAFPNIQVEFPIITLGQILRDAHGGCGIPCLSGGFNDRRLSLLMEWRLIGEEPGNWGSRFHFTTVEET